MDSRAVADKLGTDPKTLRRFLRSPISTFEAVGSGGRYDFTDQDIPTLAKRFSEWNLTQLPRKSKVVAPKRKSPTGSKKDRDAEVWAEEGPVIIPDINDPRVRAEVRRVGEERARRLDELLLAAGQHISQWRDQ